MNDLVYSASGELTYLASSCPGQMNVTPSNIVELNIVGWCWTAWPNECNMLCGADSNCGDWGSETNNDPEFLTKLPIVLAWEMTCCACANAIMSKCAAKRVRPCCLRKRTKEMSNDVASSV